MENNTIKQKYKFRNNNSFIYINNTPKILRFSKTPILGNYEKKIKNPKKNSINEKLVLKKKPFINFNFNLIQNKNLNNKKIRTITPNLKLREIVNKKFQENNIHNINNIHNLIKIRTDLPEITRNIQNKYPNSYVNTETNYKRKEQNENIDRQLKLIFVMKNKINELNKVIRDKNKEINYLKFAYQNINNSNNNNEYERIIQKKPENENNLLKEKIKNNNKKEYKSASKDRVNIMKINSIKKDNNNNINNKNIINKNNNNKNNNKLITSINKKNSETEKLNKEIQNLNKIINNLDEKYQLEIKKNKEFNQKYSYIKNCTFGINVPTVQVDEKIRNYENKIIDLEEQIFQYKEKEIKKIKKNIILSSEEYSNVLICINALMNVNKIKQENILNNINDITHENSEEVANNICNLLKISNNNLIYHFINDYIIKNKKGILFPLNLDKLLKYNISDISDNNYSNNNLFSFIKERCIIYDYNKKGIIPIDYLKHLYSEFCFKNDIEKNEKEFFNIVCICKNNNKNYSNSIYDIFYDNLKTIDNEINSDNDKYINLDNDKDNNLDNANNDNNEKVVKNFVDLIMNQELEKVKRRGSLYDFSKYNNNNNNIYSNIKKAEKKNNNISLNSKYTFKDEDSII